MHGSYFKEIPGVKQVLVNDLDPKAVEAARKNVEFNGLTLDQVCVCVCVNACVCVCVCVCVLYSTRCVWVGGGPSSNAVEAASCVCVSSRVLTCI